MTADLAFSTPWALLLAPLAWAVWRWAPPRAATAGALELPERLASAARPSGPAGEGGRGALALRILLWLGLVLALAGPQRLETAPDVSASGRDIMLALDLSGSMLIEDFDLDGERVSRLEAVKRVAANFVERRRGDRVGLTLFADRAFVAAPLTHDLAAVRQAVEEAQIGFAGRATALSEGLGLALKRAVASDSPSRVVVLLSDGRDTSRRIEAEQVAALAASHGVRIHTIALGPEDLETRPASRDAVDSAALRLIAEESGGRTWRVRGMEDLEAMAEELDRLEPNPSGRPPVTAARPLWIWPALAAFLAALGLGILREARR
ncbi:VWA domain-containing protein [Neomegalonema sp.]|uniref:VWA domain-containing protein n=1 Tax=Neomegalonema sp. TaxID=2039713 RepID=UPI00261D9A6E|nr:VWA domain-containing protein [Neomegalonema sp.]MDD2867311.1 VWA domain-containing protein [Neomegalonema sp.]